MKERMNLKGVQKKTMPRESVKSFIERTTPIGRLARRHRERKLRKKYITWQKTEGSGPMPNYGKQQEVIAYLKKFGIRTFIETGTYKGKMVYAVMPYVDDIYSIELDPVYCRRAQEKFAGYTNIHIIEGQSGEVLPQIMADIQTPCLFWLDAHYSGGMTAKGPKDSPIMQEMECILSHPNADRHVILIDDARCFTGSNGYPDVNQFKQDIATQYPHLSFDVVNDIIRIHTNKGSLMSGNEYIQPKPAWRKPNTWLLEYASNLTSQNGEDGILEKVLQTIGDRDHWCVEFGSWDGKTCSNTYKLISEKGYSAVLIEADPKRFGDLKKNFEGNPKTVYFNRFVGFEEHNSLDIILKETGIPKDFDLLSIDIDGNDYHVWQVIHEYTPKAVIIEFNPTIPKTVEFIQPKDMRISQGSSLLSIAKLAKSKGYALVCATKNNAIFVRDQFFDRFQIEDNSVNTMMVDESMVTHLFCGYDGTVFIRGYGKSPWQQIPFKESKMQILPGWARKRFSDRNAVRKKAGKIYRRWLKEK